MDNDLSSFIDLCHDFAPLSPHALIAQGFSFPEEAYHIAGPSNVPAPSSRLFVPTTGPVFSQYEHHSYSESPHSEFPDCVPDRGTPDLTLVTPLSGTFAFPPYPYLPSLYEETPWSPSIEYPALTWPNPNLPRNAPCFYPPTIANYRFADLDPLPIAMPYGGVYGTPTLCNPTICPDGGGIVKDTWPDVGLLHQASECGLPSAMETGIIRDGYPPMRKGKFTEPKRIERSRKRHAPYNIDNVDEGAKTLNPRSQHGNFGQNTSSPKTTTRRKRRKTHQSSTEDKSDDIGHSPVASSSSTTLETPVIVPPDPKKKTLSTIRRHARLKNRGITFVEGTHGYE